MSAVRLLKIFPNSHHWSCGIFSLMIIIIIIVANYPTESSLPLFVDNDNNNGDLMINVTAMDIDDVNRDIFQLIKSRGFEFEQHFVTTSDGYILQLVRIINPKIIDDRQDKLGKPIILFHGFQLTGSSFLVTSAGRLMNDGHYYEFDENGHLQQPNDTDVGNTLGFVLADRGYDVWLANYRGSIYSNNHIKFNPKSRQYWSFSMDEMIAIDLPAIIDYVIDKTNHQSIGYIGHSLGNFIMLALLSTRPEYSQKIRPYIALSPVFYTEQLKTPLKVLVPLKEILRSYQTMLGYESHKIITEICMNPNTINICRNLYLYLIGGHPRNFNENRMNVYIANIPLGSSTWVIAHFLQMIEHGNPSYFDYGPLNNLRKYGRLTPPLYDASRINSTDMALFYLSNDYFNTMINIDLLKSKLKVKLMDDYLITDPSLGHLNLIWDKHCGRLFNKRILDILARYS